MADTIANETAPRAEPRRSPSAVAERVLIIGLDGATFDVLQPLLDAGRLPNLKRAIDDGVAGTLRSTTPPITPAAWTTFLTGKQPGKHGIIDFERFDPLSNKLVFNSTRCLEHVRTIWDLLGQRDFRVGSINVPMTYPPQPVNGFMVSGFETPGPSADFAYPRDLKPRILQRWSDPTLRTNWRRKSLGGDRLFAENVDYMSRSFHQGTAMTRFLGESYGWHALMVVFKLVDNLQHKTWRYIDPRWSARHPRRRDIALQCFEECDRAVGDLLDYAQEHNATVIMVSDHGHGSLEGKVQPNLLLQQWGYLHLRGGGAQGSTRLRHVLDRLRGKTGKFAREGDVLHDLAVDFDKTRACIMHAGMAGFLYINLEGRQPTGIVPQAEYESLRDEIRDRLLGPDCQAVDPNGRHIPLFTEVHKPEELYGVTRHDQPWLPDLMLIPYDGLAVVRKIRGADPVRWLPWRRIEGTHRPDGVLIATGPGVAQGRRVNAHIADCAPTILALLGVPVPDDMDGRVVEDLFAQAPRVEREAAASAARSTKPDEEIYSEEDLQKITERLTDLGYLQ